MDANVHNVYYFSKEIETWNAIFKVSGAENLAGMRNGNIASASFNSPQSIAIYDRNMTTELHAQNLQPVLLYDEKNISCHYIHIYNYTECGVLITEDFKFKIIDRRKVHYVGMVPYEMLSIDQRKENIKEYEFEERVAFIADSGNHCIRKINVRQAHVSTYAGICGNPGF